MIMKYKNIVKGRFLNRPNRFIAKIEINGQEESVHVKNTGRCKELFVPDAAVYLSRSDNPERKTKYDLIAVEKKTSYTETLLVNVDSQIPNAVAEEWLCTSDLFSGNARIKREVFYGNSRFDVYVEDGERKAFIEVKGVTLENNGIASFPDAPTERGVKHVKELIKARKDGYEAYVLFIIQMKGISVFKPNDKTHRAFGDALREAKKEGVSVLALDCIVEKGSIIADKFVTVDLGENND